MTSSHTATSFYIAALIRVKTISNFDSSGCFTGVNDIGKVKGNIVVRRFFSILNGCHWECIIVAYIYTYCSFKVTGELSKALTVHHQCKRPADVCIVSVIDTGEACIASINDLGEARNIFSLLLVGISDSSEA
jgi:hypothetical protein